MDQKSIVYPTKTGRVGMQHVTQSLERAIVLPVTSDEFSKELASVLSVTECFQLHMERQFQFEELDGYMDGVCQLHPEFTDKVSDLKETHGRLRQTIRRLVRRLERASPTEFAIFDAICENLQDIVGRFREHNLREIELLIEALFRDTCGEG